MTRLSDPPAPAPGEERKELVWRHVRQPGERIGTWDISAPAPPQPVEVPGPQNMPLLRLQSDVRFVLGMMQETVEHMRKACVRDKCEDHPTLRALQRTMTTLQTLHDASLITGALASPETEKEVGG